MLPLLFCKRTLCNECIKLLPEQLARNWLSQLALRVLDNILDVHLCEEKIQVSNKRLQQFCSFPSILKLSLNSLKNKKQEVPVGKDHAELL